jgi:integrase
MAKINYDYSLNPHCGKPVIGGSKLSDRWSVYFYHTVDGKRKQYKESSGLNDKTDTLSIRKRKAEIVRQRLHENLETRVFDSNSNSFQKTYSEITILEDLINEYLVQTKLRLTKFTYYNYVTIFNPFKALKSNLSVADINKDFISNFLKGINAKPQTKRSYRIYLSTFFNWLIEEKKLDIVNPTLGIKLGKNDPVERHKIYSKKEIKNIIKYCDENNEIILKTIIYLVYGAQVRISEILRIQMCDFKLAENKIVLPKGKGKIKNKAKIVLLDEPLKKYLQTLPIDFEDSENAEMYFIGIKQAYAKASFVQKYRLSKNTVDTRFKQLKKDLKIEEHKTLYSFKHTGNVNLLIEGADLIELMYKNGHTKISQTETYARQLLQQVPEMKYVRKTRKDLDFK